MSCPYDAILSTYVSYNLLLVFTLNAYVLDIVIMNDNKTFTKIVALGSEKRTNNIILLLKMLDY